MAILHNTTASISYKRSGAITAAAVLYCWFGLAFLLSSLLIAILARRNGSLPVVFGNSMLAGPFSERFGVEVAILTTVPWAVVNVLDVLAGYWLWKSRKRGGVLALVLFPAGMIFWIGYALPIMIVVGPLRALLIAKGWKTLR